MQRLSTNYAAVLIATLVLATPMWAADKPVRDHDIEPDDYFTIGTVIACALSPDGGRIAYTEMRWGDMKERRTTDLWVVDVDTRHRRRLSFDRVGARSPQWSPDGAYIYFTGRYTRPGEDKPPYDGSTQVWRISPLGGDPFPVTRVKDGVGQYELTPCGKMILFTKSKKHVDDEFKDLKETYSDLEYGHGVVEFSQVWSLDLESWREKKLIDEDRVIREMALSPDATRIAMITTPDETLLSNEGWSRVDVYTLDTEKTEQLTGKEWRSKHPSPYGWVDGLAWSGDGESLAFTVSFDGYPSELLIARWRDGKASLRQIDRPDGVMLAGGALKWRGDSDDLYFLGEEKARVRVYCIESVSKKRRGKDRCVTPGDLVATAFTMNEAGDLALVMSTTEHMRDIFLVEKSGKLQRVTMTNPHAETWKFPQFEIVSWKGAYGDTVEGILELPYGYKPGDGPLPLIVKLHGGPSMSSYYRIRFWIYGRVLMPAKGYALLTPNYRGSTGYGDKFMTDLVGHENDVEVTDILKGIDAMVERSIADPDRIGVMGWSNGGLLANGLITRDTRIKAASSGAGVLDMVLQWGTEDTPGHVVNFMEALPWEDPDAYRKASPVFGLGNCRVPTIIHVGSDDPRVPAGHSRALYRALKHYLGVPTELVVYPGEGHGLTTRENRKAKMEWDLAWFDKYVLGNNGEESD